VRPVSPWCSRSTPPRSSSLREPTEAIIRLAATCICGVGPVLPTPRRARTTRSRVWSVCTGPVGPGAGAPLPAGLMPLIRTRASEPGRIFDLELPSALAAEGYRATAEPPGDQGAAAARSARPVRGSADGDDHLAVTGGVRRGAPLAPVLRHRLPGPVADGHPGDPELGQVG